jgi:hypothetical protein
MNSGFTLRHAACLVAITPLGLSLPAHSAVTVTSYWSLGEGAVGADGSSVNDGETNNINNSTGTVVNTATPSGVNGSTAYASTSGTNFQGLWMFGGGADNQTVPATDWGVQFQVRSTNTVGISGTGAFRAVYGMLDAASGGLVIEARRHSDGNVYWDVNRSGQANLIIPRNATTLVTDNAWADLALVRTGGVLNFFVDGNLAGTSTLSIGTTDGLLALGFQQGVGTNNFTGDFDEARFFTFEPGAFTTADLAYVPEPSAALLGGLGMLALLRRRR